MALPVGRIFFVNGLVDFGAVEPGKRYWVGKSGRNHQFVNGAISTFSGRGTRPDVRFTSYTFAPPLNHLSTRHRHRLGRNNAVQYSGSLLRGLSPSQRSLVFVSHSMGAAYSEGMMQAMKDRGYQIRAAIHINPFQPKNIRISRPRSEVTVHYQDPSDPVTRNILNKPVFPFLRAIAAVERHVKAAGRIGGAQYIEHDGPARDYRQQHTQPIWDRSFWARVRARVSGI